MKNILIYLLIASKILAPFADIYCLSLILKFIKDNKTYRYFMLCLIICLVFCITLTRTCRDISFLKSGAEIEALKKLLK